MIPWNASLASGLGSILAFGDALPHCIPEVTLEQRFSFALTSASSREPHRWGQEFDGDGMNCLTPVAGPRARLTNSCDDE